MGAYILGSIGAILGLAGVVITVRSQRRLNAAQAAKVDQEAGQIEDARMAKVRADLDTEYRMRRDLERTVAAHERRIAALEAQVISLGHVPVKGGG